MADDPEPDDEGPSSEQDPTRSDRDQRRMALVRRLRANTRLGSGRVRFALPVGLVVIAAGVGVWSLIRPEPEPRLSVGATVTAFFHAQRDGDCERLIGLVSEASWSDGGQLQRDEFLEQCAEAVDGYELAVDEIDVEIVDDEVHHVPPSEHGDRAVVRVRAQVDEEGPGSHEGSLVREDGTWKIETDPNVFRLGRSVKDTVRGYLEAYNDGDCEQLIDHMSEVAWSQDGDLSREEYLDSCADAAAARQEYRQPSLRASEIEVSLEEGHRGATAAVVLFGDATGSGLGVSYGDPGEPDAAVLVKDGLEWKLQANAERSDDTSSPPFLTLDHVELEARLLDELVVPDEDCFAYFDDGAPLEDTEGATRGITRDFICDILLSVYRLADDDEARSHAERIVTEIVEDLPATVEELAESSRERGAETDLEALEEYVSNRRPNRSAPVPGIPDALGVLTWCDVDGCSSAVAMAVRHGVLVKVEMQVGDLNGAAQVLQAQLDRL